MKRFVVAFLLTLSIGVMVSCANSQEQAAGSMAPLQTEGETSPPRGCEELRKRGGAC